MEKNEIVINGVHHVLVEDGDIKIPCDHCSLQSLCEFIPNDILCRLERGVTNKHFEIKDKAMSKEEFNIVVQVMGLLRCGKISTLTPNCDVREILLAEKIEQ